MIFYTARVIESIDNGEGFWKYQQIGIFRGEGDKEEQIGSYKRNYSDFYWTFFHFQKDGKDYALYSPQYTGTRIMALPSCEDIGGEEQSSFGFCPVEYYVPSFLEREWVDGKGEVRRHMVRDPKAEDLLPKPNSWWPYDEKTGTRTKTELEPSRAVTPVTFHPFGFIAGCIWGDDSSWKLQYLDLSQADKGIVKREERFGYAALPGGLRLKQCINMQGFRDDMTQAQTDAHCIVIAVQKHFNLSTGAAVEVDPYE